MYLVAYIKDNKIKRCCVFSEVPDALEELSNMADEFCSPYVVDKEELKDPDRDIIYTWEGSDGVYQFDKYTLQLTEVWIPKTS